MAEPRLRGRLFLMPAGKGLFQVLRVDVGNERRKSQPLRRAGMCFCGVRHDEWCATCGWAPPWVQARSVERDAAYERRLMEAAHRRAAVPVRVRASLDELEEVAARLAADVEGELGKMVEGVRRMGNNVDSPDQGEGDDGGRDEAGGAAER